MQREVSESAFEYLLSEILTMKVPEQLKNEQFVRLCVICAIIIWNVSFFKLFWRL